MRAPPWVLTCFSPIQPRTLSAHRVCYAALRVVSHIQRAGGVGNLPLHQSLGMWCATWCDEVAGFCLDMLLDGLVAISRWIETRIAKSIQKFREGVDDVAGCLDEFLLEHGLMACLFVHPFISMHTMLVLCSVIVSLSVDSSTCTDALSLGIFGSVVRMALKRIWI